MDAKRVIFITGTRADYGKLKPLMLAMENDPKFEIFIFVCGMHLSEKFGSTYTEVQKDGYKNIYVAFGLSQSQNGSEILGDTIRCLAGYVDNIRPDMIIVHGDRLDALAGAVVGAINNVLVGHIEGGEVSGTLDESIRHAISKLAHVHFVCNRVAHDRLIQIGEEPSRIFIIGSPDIDVMMSGALPSLEDVRRRYEIEFDRYGILMYHPVTTEFESIREKARTVVDAVLDSALSYVVILPNNDLGSEVIMSEYQRFDGSKRFRVFPSLRFEYFLSLLKNAEFIIGNSSAGIRESGVYGIPAIDIGTRQSGRYCTQTARNIQHVREDREDILSAIDHAPQFRYSSFLYGDGRSVEKFYGIVSSEDFWNIKIQKKFIDYDL